MQLAICYVSCKCLDQLGYSSMLLSSKNRSKSLSTSPRSLGVDMGCKLVHHCEKSGDCLTKVIKRKRKEIGLGCEK